jgi:hypothetical protein
VSGRLSTEPLRVDPEHTAGPIWLDDWTSIVVRLGALVAWVLVSRRHPDRETTLLRDPPAPGSDEESAPQIAR